jgi:hypothetical protein
VQRGFSKRERAAVERRAQAVARGEQVAPRRGGDLVELRGERRCDNPFCAEPHRRLHNRDGTAGRSIHACALGHVSGEGVPAFMRPGYGVPRASEPPQRGFYVAPSINIAAL